MAHFLLRKCKQYLVKQQIIIFTGINTYVFSWILNMILSGNYKNRVHFQAIPIAEYNKPANGMYGMPVFTLLNNSQNEQRAAA